jgi:hypothetical protein
MKQTDARITELVARLIALERERVEIVAEINTLQSMQSEETEPIRSDLLDGRRVKLSDLIGSEVHRLTASQTIAEHHQARGGSSVDGDQGTSDGCKNRFNLLFHDDQRRRDQQRDGARCVVGLTLDDGTSLQRGRGQLPLGARSHGR